MGECQGIFKKFSIYAISIIYITIDIALHLVVQGTSLT